MLIKRVYAKKTMRSPNLVSDSMRQGKTLHCTSNMERFKSKMSACVIVCRHTNWSYKFVHDIFREEKYLFSF